jgi:hypothetical protein
MLIDSWRLGLLFEQVSVPIIHLPKLLLVRTKRPTREVNNVAHCRQLTTRVHGTSVSQFGKEGLKILLMKSFVSWANGEMMTMIDTGAASLNQWYDVHLMRVAHALEDEMEEFDEDEDMLENDEFDVDGNTAGMNEVMI